MTLRELAEVVDGEVRGDDGRRTVRAPASTDSRHVEPGGLFAALMGERVDGHRFARAAVANGAVAVLARRDVGVPAVIVEDVREALGRIAIAVRTRHPSLDVIGVTGSVGKTTVKDLSAQLLGELGSTVATSGNLNNEIGLPLTVTRVTRQTRFAVLEMGARHIGDIAYLAGIARPRRGVVLGVGSAHIAEFGGVAAIAQAKGELVEALPPDGTAILNADDPRVVAMVDRTTASIMLFGRSPLADVRADDVRFDSSGHVRMRLRVDGQSEPVRLTIAGAHQVPNALAAAAVAHVAGLSLPQIAHGLSMARALSPARMEVRDAGGVRIINDAYNSNPDSARAALDALRIMSSGGRSIAALGPMFELGEEADREHRRLGRHAASLGLDYLLAVGPPPADLIAATAGKSGTRARLCRNPTEALAVLRSIARPGDTVLIKGARVSGLDWLADALAAELERASPEVSHPSGGTTSHGH